MAKKKSNKNLSNGRTEVLLEAIQSDFRIFGENLELLDNKIDGGFKEVNGRLDRIEDELAVIRNDLKEKVGRDELKLLESRVLRLERGLSGKK